MGSVPAGLVVVSLSYLIAKFMSYFVKFQRIGWTIIMLVDGNKISSWHDSSLLVDLSFQWL